MSPAASDHGLLAVIDSWPVEFAAAAVIDLEAGDAVVRHGATDRVVRLASISKIITTWACLVAVEEGSITLDTAAGQSGCTFRHLLSHSGGYAFDGVDPISRPASRRIYSNTGIELAAAAVEQATGVAFHEYLAEAVFQPLMMTTAELTGSPAHGVHASVDDLVALVREIAHPTLLAQSTVDDALSVQFGDLAGLVPGVGRFRPCPWGLGGELHGSKHPHWMGTSNSPETFGHFGGSGSMMWFDPVAQVGLIALTDRNFDEWATDAVSLWSTLSDAVIDDSVSRRRSLES